MRSGRSSSNFSLALYIENIKRFWLLGFAGFVIMFLSAPFTLISKYGKVEVWMVRDLLNSHNFGFLFVEGVMSVAAAVAVFNYLNNTGSVSLMHSMPFSRKGLYLTNFLSGLTLAEAPFLLNALLVVLLKQPVIYGYYDYAGGTEQYISNDIFTFAAIGRWVLVAVVTIFFVYTVSVLGMMVSGNSVIGFLTAGAFNFLFAALIMCGYIYAEKYFFGFSSDESAFLDLAVNTNPIMYFPIYGWSLSSLFLYMAAALLLYILGGVLYSRRKLERAGESYVFRIMQHVVCFLLTFFAATLVGAIFNSFDSINIAGLALGAVAGFVIARMIVKKTARVFNADSFKTFGIYALIIALVVACFAFDIFGYSAWQPKTSDVESVIFYNSNITLNPGAHTVFCDAENIDAVKRFQKQIVADRKNTAEDSGDNTTYSSIIIRYDLKNGKRVSRSYAATNDQLINSGDLKALYESSETKAMADRLMALDPSQITVNIDNGFYNTIVSRNEHIESSQYGTQDYGYELTEDDISSLVKAYACDVNFRSYSDMIDGSVPAATIYLKYSFEAPSGIDAREQFHNIFGYSYVSPSKLNGSANNNEPVEYTAQFTLPVDRHCTNTLEWFNAHNINLSSIFTDYQGNECYFGAVYAYSEEASDSGDYPVDNGITVIPESGAGRVIITDPEQLSDLYLNYAVSGVYYIPEKENALTVKIMQLDVSSDKLGQPYWYINRECYLDRNNVPEWLKAELDAYIN